MSNISSLTGPTEQPLWEFTLSKLLKQQVVAGASRPCIIFSEANYRATYEQLYQKSLVVAKGLLAAGISKGDNIGILAGNCPAYVELLFATSHVGAALVVLNSTYTPVELKSAVKHTACKLLFTSASIGKLTNKAVLAMLEDPTSQQDLAGMRTIMVNGLVEPCTFETYKTLTERGNKISDYQLYSRMRLGECNDICNLQFTSGTTGNPKAAMLTHRNIINNGRFVGDRMRLTPSDIVCCPPPLFHCFGLVLGLLAALTHGSSIVFPCETFQAKSVLQAIAKERCTALHGVPAMFAAELELINSDVDLSSLRTGIGAGAPLSKTMMAALREKMNMPEITNTYGMTETSPASFMTFTHDPVQKRLTTVGKILPHMRAKIINANGEIVPIGSRGELCVAGFALQKGYWQNPEKTAEVMRTDEDGVLWMHSGDEATFDVNGYCRITGRIKDIIIRGGENIFPLEIEERIMQHPAVVQVSVIGVADAKYGEAVAAFLQHRNTIPLPTTQELKDFVRKTLGWHKAPEHVFWLGPEEDFPKTGSGKIKKHVLKETAEMSLKKVKRGTKL